MGMRARNDLTGAIARHLAESVDQAPPWARLTAVATWNVLKWTFIWWGIFFLAAWSAYGLFFGWVANGMLPPTGLR